MLIPNSGMFLWINLILTLLEESCSLSELESIVTTLPKDLEQMLVLLDSIHCNSVPGKLEDLLVVANCYLSEGTESF